MIAATLYLVVILFFNAMHGFVGGKLVKIKKAILIGLCVLFLINLGLSFIRIHELELKGIHSVSVIYTSLLVFSVLFFLALKNTFKKVLVIIVLSLSIPVMFFVLFLESSMAAYPVDDTYTLKVSDGGIMSFGREIRFTKTKYLLFDKTYYSTTAVGVFNINDIVVEKKDDHYEVQIDDLSNNKEPSVEILKVYFDWLKESNY